MFRFIITDMFQHIRLYTDKKVSYTQKTIEFVLGENVIYLLF
jgi:hypothetical protein